MNKYLLNDEAIDKELGGWASNSQVRTHATAIAQATVKHCLEQLEKEGMLRCDFAIQRGKNRCYRKTCRRCAALREVGA